MVLCQGQFFSMNVSLSCTASYFQRGIKHLKNQHYLWWEGMLTLVEKQQPPSLPSPAGIQISRGNVVDSAVSQSSAAVRKTLSFVLLLSTNSYPLKPFFIILTLTEGHTLPSCPALSSPPLPSPSGSCLLSFSSSTLLLSLYIYKVFLFFVHMHMQLSMFSESLGEVRGQCGFGVLHCQLPLKGPETKHLNILTNADSLCQPQG